MSENYERPIQSREETVEELLQEIYGLEDDCEAYADRIDELEKEVASLRKLKAENDVLRKEIEASYKHNETINKWWKFKLERLELSHSHNNQPTQGDKPWVHHIESNDISLR